MEQDHFKSDLVKIIVLFAIFLGIVIALAIWNKNTGIFGIVAERILG
ncbi:hypothetical protein HOE31_03130 [bacterium]|jgi:hypothetical protein|nr:hypothetical protein [bacterium]MBT4121916.1 hypothetical protein [bacterium]MBT4495312.1 hypothetical protein [bacterium]MBT4763657.1 hypothetical protein [bacterium]MBT5942349.1 hypothetical protein [bacterium]